MDTAQAASQRSWTSETIISIHQWTATLWTIRLTRPEGFAFVPGHYARLGLDNDGQGPVWRAYSMVSAPDDHELEFLIGLIPDGAFCRQLATLRVGDPVLLDTNAMGFFVASQLAAGTSLWMMATGTGIGPYLSLLRDARLVQDYQQLVVVHSVRHAAELAYAHELQMLAAASGGRLCHVPIVTREAGATPLAGRIPQLLDSGALEARVGLTVDVSSARVMVCGNPEFTAEMRTLLSNRGFQPCRRGISGSMLFENYW